MPDRAGRVASTARKASAVLLAFGLVWTTLAGQMCLAHAWMAKSAVLMSGENGVALGMGLGLCLAGAFGFWVVREPRTDMFKGSVIALTVVFAPLALAAAPVCYVGVCSALLWASGYERCADPELVRAYTTGSGRNRKEYEVFAQARDGGCPATLARIRRRG
ncbi:MAG TPA: hypothetical protein VGC15_23875 [Acetobacteraceae bacterium]